MSQITNLELDASGSGAVMTVTGNTGGAVSPDGAGNIDILGDGTIVITTGNPGTNTLTISFDAAASGAILTVTTDDANVVSPDVAGNMNLVGAHGLNTSGAVANTASVQIDNAITLGDLSNIAAGSDALTIATGDITFSATNNVGNLNFPNTHSSGNAGVINIGDVRIHNFDGSVTDRNVFIGENSGNFSSTGSPLIGIGKDTFSSITSGAQSVAIGNAALSAMTSGSQNIGIGDDVMLVATDAGRNIGIGIQALLDLTSGSYNIAMGRVAAHDITTGGFNIAIGSGEDNVGTIQNALGNLTTGSHNIGIGSETSSTTGGAGSAYTGAESSNICLGGATVGTVGESNVMRLGTTGSSAGQVNKAFIAGVHNVTPGGASIEMVVMDSNGQAGTQAIPAGTLDGIIPDSGTSPVVPDGSGDITLTGGTTGLTFVGGTNTLTQSGTLVVGNGGTGATTLLDHGVLVGSGTAAVTPLAVGTTGQLLVGASAADPAFASSATGDFTFTSATAAQDRTLTVSNTDATAANYSAAHLELVTQSASTGDPYIRFNVNGGQDYAIGIDNSASDVLLIKDDTNPSTGNTLWQMTAAGERTLPSQPAFLAFLGTSDLNVTGNSAAYTLGSGNALTEVYDVNSDFVTTGTFTAPVTGKYVFFASILVFGCTQATQGVLAFVASNRTLDMRNGRTASSQNLGLFGSLQVDMDAADTLTFRVTVFGETGDTDDINGGSTTTYCGGYLAV